MNAKPAARLAAVITVVALVSAPTCLGQLLHFNLSGTLDSPNGAYPLLAPQFNASFDLPSDPRDLIAYPYAVLLYTSVTYSNAGITTSDPHTYVEFDGELMGGGVYIFFSRTNWFPNGFAISSFQGVPVVYSGTISEPHFSPGVFDLSSAQMRVAAQGAGGPGDSPISRPILLITPADTTPPTISISTSPASLWPPTGRMVPITVAGTVTDDEPAGSGVNPSTVRYAVADQYGTDQPSGAVDLQSDGSYVFVVLLQASRRGPDMGGRQYTITVSAQDWAGNAGSALEHITVPHASGGPGFRGALPSRRLLTN